MFHGIPQKYPDLELAVFHGIPDPELAVFHGNPE